MAFSRYVYAPRKRSDLDQRYVGTVKINSKIRRAVLRGDISVSRHILKEGERLDTLSFRYFNDSSLWWLIAACSGIGWGLQVPPGTVLNIPTQVNQVMRFMR